MAMTLQEGILWVLSNTSDKEQMVKSLGKQISTW